MKVLLALWLAVTVAEAARLLAVFPTNTKSHYAMYGKVIDALARNNHSITLITHFPMKNPPCNIEQISLAGTIPEIKNNLTKDHDSLKPYFVHNLEEIMKECVHACETVSKIPAVRALVNSKNTYDMVIVEVFGSECFLPLGQKFKAPVVGFLSSVPLPWLNEQLGNPEETTYVPSYMMGYGQRMTMWERLVNTFAVMVAKVMYKYKSQASSQVIADRLFGPGPTLEALAQNYSLVLSNSHFSINEVRPLVPTLVEVGGLHLDDMQTLPRDMKRLLDSSNEGVIYWSFGSMSRIETIPSAALSRVLAVLSELPQTVLVRMDRRLLAANLSVPDNLVTMDWIPQYATLCHPNVKLFISHGGLLGTQEAVACGVPMLIVPLFADQALNARAMLDRGVARVLHLRHSSEEDWRDALHSLLRSPEYKENALRLRDIFLDRPLKPIDMSIYWIEYVLRHKGAMHMRSPALDLHLYQYYLLDIIILTTAATATTIFTLHKLYRYFNSCCIQWWKTKDKHMLGNRLFKKNFGFMVLLLWWYKMKVN